MLLPEFKVKKDESQKALTSLCVLEQSVSNAVQKFKIKRAALKVQVMSVNKTLPACSKLYLIFEINSSRNACGMYLIENKKSQTRKLI